MTHHSSSGLLTSGVPLRPMIRSRLLVFAVRHRTEVERTVRGLRSAWHSSYTSVVGTLGPGMSKSYGRMS